MTLNEDCINRLENWKFNSALTYLDNEASEKETDTINALSRMFGNSGWFDGDMAHVIWAAVSRVVEGWPDEEER